MSTVKPIKKLAKLRTSLESHTRSGRLHNVYPARASQGRGFWRARDIDLEDESASFSDWERTHGIRTQEENLIILNMGDGTGLVFRGGWHWHGRLSSKLKHFIDKELVSGMRGRVGASSKKRLRRRPAFNL